MTNKQQNYQNQTTIFGDFAVYPKLSEQELEYLNFFINQQHYLNENILDQGLYCLDKIKKESNLDFLKEIYIEMNGVSLQQLINNFQLNKSKHQEFVPSLTCPLKIYSSEEESFLTIDYKNKNRENGVFWLVFFIEHFFKKDAIAKTLKKELSFLKEHDINGTIWQKAGGNWNAQKITILNNKVFLSYMATPLIYNSTLKFDVNFLNHKSIFTEKIPPSINKNIFYKQYHDMSIINIIKYNKETKKELICLPQNDLLDKLILNAQLNNDLSLKLINNKIIKV